MERCGAKTRAGRPCRKPAGWGTPNQTGRCKLHGGLTPIKSGRYSKIKREAIRELIEEHASDEDPLDIHPELAAARAIFQDFLERYYEWRPAFLAWHASFSDEYLKELAKYQEKAKHDAEADRLLVELREVYDACRTEGVFPPDPLGFEKKPRQVLDLADAVRHLDTIAKIAQREKKLLLENAISRKDLLRVLTEMTRVVERVVPDEELRTRISDGWAGIQLA